MRSLLTLGFCAASIASLLAQSLPAESPRALPADTRPSDQRLSELRNLNSEFPFKTVADTANWPARREQIRQRILVSQGLWPMPTKVDLNPVIHGRVEREDYVVDRVFFESIPGHFVTGSLYRPKGKQGPYPVILSPHGHWNEGRFYDAGEAQIRSDLAKGAERFEVGGRFPIQARAVQLARMGCMVFVYDMTGNADSIQIGHRPENWTHLDRETDWGFFSAQAELRLQNMMGLQTWNSIRAIDFVLGLDDTDPERIGVTGASGGGTQSMIIGAIDDRIAAAMPCVMVSTAMQGGCTCENAPYLRIDQGNVDIAAAIAPRPLGLTAANDWTIELETKGYPDLRQLYTDLGQQNRLTAAFNVHFFHNYNHVNRCVMYGFFNRHFQLGFEEPILERDFNPLTRDEATVWSGSYPAPAGDAVGDAHEVEMIKLATEDSQQRIGELIPTTKHELEDYRRVIGGAWETILARSIDQVGQVAFRETKNLEKSGLSASLGTLDHDGEQLPTVRITKPSVQTKSTVIWVTDQGKAGLFEGESVAPIIADLAASGVSVLSADLIGQGEFTPDGNPIAKQPMWYQRGGENGWARFSGYTYGYNHSLFVKRVHDVLTQIKHASAAGQSVYLVALGNQAGAIAVAARSQAGDQVDRTFIDLDGFRFADLKQQDDPMFVPGAVKYLDVDGLLSLCAGSRMDVVGDESDLVRDVARAAGATDSIHWHSSRDGLLKAVRRSLEME